MQKCKRFLSVILCGAVLAVPAHGITLNTNACDNPTYRRNNPDKCTDKSFSFATTGLIAGGTLSAIGAGLAILGMSGGGSSSDATPVNDVSIPRPSTQYNYYQVGSDVTTTQLTAIKSSADYIRNTAQYDEIRLAYSLARGFTGQGSTIAILDAGDDTWHGTKVAQVASGPISPDATVNTYKITDSQYNFLSYDEIGEIINSAKNTNIFNASWASTSIYAPDIKNRQQFEHLTSAGFVSSIVNQATKNDAIFVWAAGNSGTSQSSGLSALPLVVPELQGHFINVVAWDNETQSLADFSNACGITQQYCITAPGTNISAGYSTLNGTSFSAPIVSSAVSVIRQAFPYMNSSEITQLLFTTARDLGEVGVDAVYGHGMLDLERATRPVGTSLVPISETVSTPLQTATVSGTIGAKIQSADLELAFVDDFGRAFTTPLNNNIRIKNRGRGFDQLRQSTTQNATIGNFQIGLRHSDFLGANGFLGTDNQTQISYFATNGSVSLGDLELFQRTEFGISSPNASAESIISNFSDIYTTSIKLGARTGDWTFSVATNDAILSGTMTMHIPVGKTNTGTLMFRDYTMDLTARPAIEYSVAYKNLTATFVDNPYGTDEFYVIAKTQIKF
ncbi:MAG: S8 family serine peptidase [Alphaproteobacteria bacterium]|nr:S8 family serine peptidase [Alphaproteobacteria bacterium]MBR5575295.1 S8 family serine peptidase [Alphaproteobacteria bacterium]